MLDLLLWKTLFRWRARARRVTGDATYGTKENIAAIEGARIRAYRSRRVRGADHSSRVFQHAVPFLDVG